MKKRDYVEVEINVIPTVKCECLFLSLEVGLEGVEDEFAYEL